MRDYMKSGRLFRSFMMTTGMALLAAMPCAGMAQASDPPEDQEAYDNIVVTAVRQGGAQDISHFRQASFDSDALPPIDSLTVEGLFGEHDLAMVGTTKCAEYFCLAGQAMNAAIPLRPDDRYFVGIGFGSNIDATSLQRQPLSVVAVIDRSGSMQGTPMDHVKTGLRQMVSQLRDSDRLTLVIYGTHSLVHLPPTNVRGNRDMLLAAIDSIEIDGSTNMEEGLAIGYRTALTEAVDFKGKTRVMLFTDEQPNVGATDAASFMGMAREASIKGVGLTTIGVGVQYDGALASKISSVRGGNLFFVANREQANDLFSKEFSNMVSEVAYDMVIRLEPHTGYKISGVFGVPAEVMEEGKDGAIEVTVPTAFLSSNSGGIYVGLARADAREHLPASPLKGQALMAASMRYIRATDGKPGATNIVVRDVAASPDKGMTLAHMLVDEYVTLTDAMQRFHTKSDRRGAYAQLAGLKQRLDGAGLPELRKEQELVNSLHTKAAYFAGFAGELPKGMRHLGVLGNWTVTKVVGLEDVYRGDRVTFDNSNRMTTLFKKERRGKTDVQQAFMINDKEIILPNDKLRFAYYANGNRLTLITQDGLGILDMVKAEGASD